MLQLYPALAAELPASTPCFPFFGGKDVDGRVISREDALRAFAGP